MKEKGQYYVLKEKAVPESPLKGGRGKAAD